MVHPEDRVESGRIRVGHPSECLIPSHVHVDSVVGDTLYGTNPEKVAVVIGCGIWAPETEISHRDVCGWREEGLAETSGNIHIPIGNCCRIASIDCGSTQNVHTPDNEK